MQKNVMKAGDIVDVYKARFKKLHKYYHKLLEDFEPNDIHHFRLEIKRLRAFLQLINLSLQTNNKIPKPLKSFYDLTGNIRNLQLHQHRVVNICNNLSLEVPALYLQYLDEEEKAIRKQARQMAKDISIKDFENKLIEHAPGRLTSETQRDFIQMKLARFIELITLSFYTDEALHEVRKIIKDVMYNSKYIDPAIVPAYFSGLKGLKVMDAATAELGDYHDLCISLSLLNSTYVASIAGDEEAGVLNELKIQLQLRKDVMKIGIIELLKQLEQNLKRKTDSGAAEAIITNADHKHLIE